VPHLYSIKDIEAIVGIKAHTIRVWEQRYNLTSPNRSDTNIRAYSEEDLRKLLNVSVLYRFGYKISELANMNESKLCQLVQDHTLKSEAASGKMMALTTAMLDLNETQFERLLSTSILQLGLQRTMEEVIFPFFQQIGIMWQTGIINPAHEHFITNLIRQKLIVAIDGQSSQDRPHAPRFLLFLPENEWHEIGLLYACFVVRSKGAKCIYLGQNVPYPDLQVVCEIYQPQVLFTVLTSPLTTISAEEYLIRLQKDFPKQTILASGRQALDVKHLLPSGICLLESLSEMVSKLNQLLNVQLN
jgi:DNA-binding transcriptional MerR regulator